MDEVYSSVFLVFGRKKQNWFTLPTKMRNIACLERSIVLEPIKKKSGFYAFALGVSAMIACAGGLFMSSALAQQPQGSSQPGFVQGSVPALEQDFGVRKNQLLLSARKALAAGDIASTERFVSELESLNLQYSEKEDQPQYITALVQQYKDVLQKLRTEGQTEANRKAYADVLNRQAFGLMLKGDLETAEKLAQMSEAQGVMFSQEYVATGLDSKSILKRIQNTKIAKVAESLAANPSTPEAQVSLAVQRQLEQAADILQKGRASLAAGQVDQAENFCRQAVALRIPENVYPQGSDSPMRLQGDIARARLGVQQAGGNVPAGGGIANNNTTVPANYNSNVDNTQIRQVSNNSLDLPMEGFAAPLGLPYGENGLLDEANRQGLNLVDQINAEMTRDISAAYRVRKNQPQEALNILFNARARVENSELDPMTRQQTLKQIDFAIDATKTFMESNRPQMELKEANALVLEELEARRNDKEFVENKLKELFQQIDQCLNEGRTEDAVYLAGKAKELAPDNTAANLVYQTTQMQDDIRRYDAIRSAKTAGFTSAMLSVDAASVPFGNDHNPIQFNQDYWVNRVKPRRNMTEAMGTNRPETELEILRKMSMPVRIDFEEMVPLGEVISYMQSLTGIAMVPDSRALLEADITLDQLTRVQLPTEISLKSALNLILGQHGLTYVIKNEVLTITTPQRSKGQLIQKTYYIGDLLPSGQNMPSNDQFSLEAAHRRAMETAAGRGRNNNGFGNSTSPFSNLGTNNGTFDPAVMAQINPGSGSFPSGSFAPNSNQYDPAGSWGGGGDPSQIINLIQAVTGEDGAWDDGNVPEPQYYSPNLSLVIKQTEDIHEEIVDLLRQLRKLNDLQVTVEVRFITLSDSFFERIGIDMDLNFRNKGAGPKTQMETEMLIGDSYKYTDTSIHGSNVVVGMSELGTFNANLDVPVRQNSFANTVPSFGSFMPDAGATLGFAILSDVEAFFFMNAAQGDSRSNVLQAPKVTTFNGQYASIYDGSETPFVTSVNPVVADFSAAYQPVIMVLREGTNLTVQAVVTHDRQNVRLVLNPVFSKITNKSNFRFDGEDVTEDSDTEKTKGDSKNPAASDEKDKNRTSTVRRSGVTIQQPIMASVNVSTVVSVPDGGTILLGGIKRLSEGRSEQGVPILNKIPFVNRLFMNSAIGRDTQSIMLMVTPRILIQEEEEEYMLGSMPTVY